eukprot:6179649-Pleurochrysis_carterae.AAC.2
MIVFAPCVHQDMFSRGGDVRVTAFYKQRRMACVGKSEVHARHLHARIEFRSAVVSGSRAASQNESSSGSEGISDN